MVGYDYLELNPEEKSEKDEKLIMKETQNDETRIKV